MTSEEAIGRVKELVQQNQQIQKMVQQYQNSLNQNVGYIKGLIESFELKPEDLEDTTKEVKQ